MISQAHIQCLMRYIQFVRQIYGWYAASSVHTQYHFRQPLLIRQLLMYVQQCCTHLDHGKVIFIDSFHLKRHSQLHLVVIIIHHNVVDVLKFLKRNVQCGILFAHLFHSVHFRHDVFP